MSLLVRKLTVLSFLLVFVSGTAFASKDVKLEISKPLHDGSVTISVTVGGVTKTVPVPNIKGTDSARDKALKVQTELNKPANNFGATLPPAPSSTLTIPSLDDKAVVDFKDAGTGETSRKLSSTGLKGGSLAYSSLFEAGSAVTGGFFTDLDSTSNTLDLTQDTQGQALTQNFFDFFATQDLGSIGITNLALVDGTILVNYNPLDTLVDAGVIFGSTSATGIVNADISGTSVPEPSTFPLFASGLVGLILFGRKRYLRRA
jgi:PEP-CTERM motif-containing protein